MAISKRNANRIRVGITNAKYHIGVIEMVNRGTILQSFGESLIASSDYVYSDDLAHRAYMRTFDTAIKKSINRVIVESVTRIKKFHENEGRD